MAKKAPSLVVREYHFVDPATGVKSLISRDEKGRLVYTNSAGKLSRLPDSLIPDEYSSRRYCPRSPPRPTSCQS